MYIGYCILLTESVFRILRIIHIVRFVHFQSFENIVWMRDGCVRVRLSLHGTFFHQTLSVRKSLQNICINCNYGNMFLPQNVLYTAIYIVHSSFRYDEFQDMRIRCCAMPRPNRKLLWIKCYSRLEPSEVFLLPCYFGIIILTYRSVFSPTHEAAFRMREEKKSKQTTRHAFASTVWLLLITHSLHSYRYLWAEKKEEKTETLRDVRTLFQMYELQYNSTGDLKVFYDMLLIRMQRLLLLRVVVTSRFVESRGFWKRARW